MTRLNWEKAARQDRVTDANRDAPTQRQLTLLRTLCKERGLTYTPPATRADASAKITAVLAQPRPTSRKRRRAPRSTDQRARARVRHIS